MDKNIDRAGIIIIEKFRNSNVVTLFGKKEGEYSILLDKVDPQVDKNPMDTINRISQQLTANLFKLNIEDLANISKIVFDSTLIYILYIDEIDDSAFFKNVKLIKQNCENVPDWLQNDDLIRVPLENILQLIRRDLDYNTDLKVDDFYSNSYLVSLKTLLYFQHSESLILNITEDSPKRLFKIINKKSRMNCLDGTVSYITSNLTSVRLSQHRQNISSEKLRTTARTVPAINDQKKIEEAYFDVRDSSAPTGWKRIYRDPSKPKDLSKSSEEVWGTLPSPNIRSTTSKEEEFRPLRSTVTSSKRGKTEIFPIPPFVKSNGNGVPLSQLPQFAKSRVPSKSAGIIEYANAPKSQDATYALFLIPDLTKNRENLFVFKCNRSKVPHIKLTGFSENQPNIREMVRIAEFLSQSGKSNQRWYLKGRNEPRIDFSRIRFQSNFLDKVSQMLSDNHFKNIKGPKFSKDKWHITFDCNVNQGILEQMTSSEQTWSYAIYAKEDGDMKIIQTFPVTYF